MASTRGAGLELWFRGQSQKQIPKPSLYRGEFRSKSGDSRVAIEFERRGKQFSRDRSPSITGTLFPHATLRYTDKAARLDRWRAASALLFPAKSNHRRKAAKASGRVGFDPFSLNKLVMRWKDTIALPGWKEVKPWLPKDPTRCLPPRYPIAIDPTHIDLRLAVQRSHFTLFGRDKAGFERLARRKGKKLRLARIVVRGRKNVAAHRRRVGSMRSPRDFRLP